MGTGSAKFSGPFWKSEIRIFTKRMGSQEKNIPRYDPDSMITMSFVYNLVEYLKGNQRVTGSTPVGRSQKLLFPGILSYFPVLLLVRHRVKLRPPCKEKIQRVMVSVW